MDISFWGLVAYLALFFFRPQEMYQFLVPLRLALMVPLITLVLMIVNGKIRIPKCAESILFILFLFLSIVSALLSQYFGMSLIILPELYKPIILFFMIVMVLKDEKSIKRFTYIILIFTIFDNLMSVYAYRNGILGARPILYRLGSYYGGIGGSANEYGLHMLMVLPFTIILMKYETSFIKKAFFVFAFFSYSYCFTRTLSRGAMVASITVLIQLFVVQRKNLKYLVLMIAVLTFLFYKTPDSFWERMETITGNEEIADGAIRSRIIALEDGIELIKQNPVFGVGIGSFRFAREKVEKFGREDTEQHIAHNTYLEIAAETGLVNVIVFISLIIVVLKSSINSEKFFEEREYPYLKALSQSLRIGFVAFLVSGIFLSQEYYRFFYIFIGILTSIKILRKEIEKGKV